MKNKGPNRRGWVQMLGLSVLLFFAVAVLSAIPFIRDWELRFADTFFRLSPSPKQKSEVVLVTLDDESLQRYGRWPWSRTLLAKLTSSLVKGGASVVGLDILLSEPQTPDADRALENALQSGRVVIVDKIASYWDGPHWMEPLPQFARAAAAVGHAQAPLEQDSVCRRYPPLELSLDGARWAFAVFRSWRGLAAVGVFAVTAAALYAVALLVFIIGSRIVPAGSMMLAVILAPLLVYTADFVLVERSVTQQLLGLRSWLALLGKDGMAREGEDLTWRLELLQQLQTELGSLYELHKTLLESTQDLVAIFDEQGKLLLKNHAFAKAYHLFPDASLSLEQARTQWIASDDAPLTHRESIEEGEVSLDGELYSVRIAPLPPTRLSPKGGTILTLTNLRTRVERDRARAEALGFITHELRTPLASIQGFAELMMSYPESPLCVGAPDTTFRELKRGLAR